MSSAQGRLPSNQQEGYNYSAIEQNSRHIKDLFKKLQKRALRVERSLSHTRDLYFRNVQQLRNEHELNNKDLKDEQDHIFKNGIPLSSQPTDAVGVGGGGTRAHKHTRRGPSKLDSGLEKLKKPLSPKNNPNLQIKDDYEHLTTPLKELDQQRQKQQQEQDFENLYAKQRENVKKTLVTVETEAPNPIVAAIFSRDPEKQAEISHVDYLLVMGKPATRATILNKLNRMFRQEIREYGDDKFEILLGECNDRRIMFKLINGDITLDQFIVKVACDAGGIKYFCKDDLIQQGVPVEFFQETDFRNDVTGVERQFVERLKETEPDIAKAPDDELVPHFIGHPGVNQKTQQYKKHNKIVTSDLNKWRTDRRCVKSVFSIVPDDLRARQHEKKESKFQTFSKLKRFPYDTKLEGDFATLPRGGGSCDRIKAARKNNDVASVSHVQHMANMMNIQEAEMNKSRAANSVSPQSSIMVTSSTKGRAKNVQQQPAKEGIEKHLRHSLLFIRKLLNEREEGTIHYDESTKINMMYQQELTEYLDNQKKEKLMKQGMDQKGHLETIHFVRGELKKKKKGVRQILQEAGVIKEVSKFDINEFLKLKNISPEEADGKNNEDLLRQKLELMMVECQERYKREFSRKKQQKRDPLDFLKIDAKRRAEPIIMHDQSDMQVLQQVAVPNNKQEESHKDLPTATSLFQPVNIYLPQEESEKDLEQEAHENSSTGQPQLQHMGLSVHPDSFMNYNGPAFSPRIAKDVALVNADLPVDAQEKRLTSTAGSPSNQALTPASDLGTMCQRPFAKTHKLIEMESHRSSKRMSQRSKPRDRPKPPSNNNQQLLKFKRKDASSINAVSETRNGSLPQKEIMSVNVDQIKVNKDKDTERVEDLVKIAKQVQYPGQVLLQSIPIDLHAETAKNRTISVEPAHHRAFGVRRKSAPANRNLDFKTRKMMRTIDDQLSSNISTQAPGGRTGRHLRQRHSSVTSRKARTNKTAKAGTTFEYYNYQPARDNQEIKSLLQQLAFKVPEATSRVEDGPNLSRQLKSASTDAAKALQDTNDYKDNTRIRKIEALNKQQLERIGFGSGVFMDKLLPPSSMLAYPSQRDPNGTETALSNAISYKEQDKEKFIKYVESLGIFVNRRSNTAFSAKGRKDMLDSAGSKSIVKQTNEYEIGMQRSKKDVSVGMSLDRRDTNSQSHSQAPAAELQSNQENDKPTEYIHYRNQQEQDQLASNNTRYQIIVMKTPSPEPRAAQPAGTPQTVTRGDTQQFRRSDNIENPQNMQHLSIVLKQSHYEKAEGRQTLYQNTMSQQTQEISQSKTSLQNPMQRDAVRASGETGHHLEATQNVDMNEMDRANFTNTIIRNNSSKFTVEAPRAAKKSTNYAHTALSPEFVSTGKRSNDLKTVLVSHQDTATLMNSGSRDRNESVDNFHFKPQYPAAGSAQQNLQDVLQAQNAQQQLNGGLNKLMSQTLSLDGNHFVILNPNQLTQDGQITHNQHLIRILGSKAAQGYGRAEQLAEGAPSGVHENNTNSTPMLLMNSDQAHQHQQSSLYHENGKARSIMDTSTHPGEASRHDDLGHIAMKVNVLSSSKSQKDNNVRMVPVDRALHMFNNPSQSNAHGHDSRRRSALNDGFLHRMQQQSNHKRAAYREFRHPLEVTPSSGTVKRIDQLQHRLSSNHIGEGVQVDYHEEPGIYSSDAQSTLKEEQVLSLSNENERDEQQAELSTNRDHSLDYRDNNKVISKVYREAYIARSKKMNNLKSLSLLRKNRAADFQHFLKQTVQQLNGQPRRALRGTPLGSKPIVSSKHELSEITRRHQQLLQREERVATAERARSQNPTASNRSATPHQDLMITPQMPSGTRIESKKNIMMSHATTPVNEIPHSRMLNRHHLSGKGEPTSSKRNSDLAEFVAGKTRMARKLRAGSSHHVKNSRSGSRFRHQSGTSQHITASLDQEGILQEISQDDNL